MISEEKMAHIVTLLVNGIWKADLVDYPDEEATMREAKKIANLYIKDYNQVGELARKRILSQKNPPLEFSPQFETLYNKYFEEELRKKGG